MFNIFSIRYIVPIGAVLWFSICIYIGKLKNEKVLAISLIIIFIICLTGVSQTINFSNGLNEQGNPIDLLSSLNSEDNVIVYTQEFHYINFHNYLNETKEYKSDFYMPYTPKNISTIENISEIPEKSNIYIIKAIDYKTKNDFDNVQVDNITYEKYGSYKNIWIIHVK